MTSWWDVFIYFCIHVITLSVYNIHQRKPISSSLQVLIVIGFVTLVACIAGAFLHIYRKELPHKGLLATESTQNNTSSLATNGTSPQAIPSEPSVQRDQEVLPKRAKRAIIFRPLFVYRQQEIKKQRYKERREPQPQTTTTTQKPKYASAYSYGSSYYMKG